MEDRAIQALIRQAADGDGSAMAELSKSYERPLRLSIRRRLGRELRARVDTDDIFQSTIVAAIGDLDGFAYQGKQAFVGWLSTIAERRIRMAARKHRAEKRDLRRERPIGDEEEFPGAMTSPTAGAARGEMTALIRDVVPRLPERERRVVELHSFEGKSFAKVAEELGLPDKNAARHIFQRALKELGELLDDSARSV